MRTAMAGAAEGCRKLTDSLVGPLVILLVPHDREASTTNARVVSRNGANAQSRRDDRVDGVSSILEDLDADLGARRSLCVCQRETSSGVIQKIGHSCKRV